LANLVDALPRLPAPIQKAILTLIDSIVAASKAPIHCDSREVNYRLGRLTGCLQNLVSAAQALPQPKKASKNWKSQDSWDKFEIALRLAQELLELDSIQKDTRK